MAKLKREANFCVKEFPIFDAKLRFALLVTLRSPFFSLRKEIGLLFEWVNF